ncbi:MAG: hypothetical protein ACYC21_09670 [Eubacteriales bacterium]
MSRKNLLLLGIVFILSLAGFMLGQAVNAAIGSPGTQSDPLVTKSYIDGEVGKLQSQIDTLKADVETLKAK